VDDRVAGDRERRRRQYDQDRAGNNQLQEGHADFWISVLVRGFSSAHDGSFRDFIASAALRKPYCFT
jgi:hypothetical protein